MSEILEKVIIEDYLYELNEDRIAKFPLEDRDRSKLLVVNRADNSIEHKNFYNLIEYIPQDSLLVWNDTKVIPARIPVKKSRAAAKRSFCY